MEYEIVEEIGNKIIDFFLTKEYLDLLPYIKIFIILYTIVYCLAFIPSLYKLFTKEKINKFFAFIPFYNLYVFFGIINLPKYLAYIPIINFLVLFFAPYNLSNIYGLKKYQSILSVLVPFIYIPYICYSNREKLRKKEHNIFLKTASDIDEIESRLDADSKLAEFNENIGSNTDNNSHFFSNIQKQIDDIEKNCIQDDYNDEAYFTNNMKEKTELKEDSIEIEEIVDELDIFDEISSTDIRNIGIEKKEKLIESSSSLNIVNNANYKEYDEKNISNETIAFGGVEKNEELVEKKFASKNNDLKCPFCNSSLIGSNGTCPGCGRDIRNYLYKT